MAGVICRMLNEECRMQPQYSIVYNNNNNNNNNNSHLLHTLATEVELQVGSATENVQLQNC